MYKIVDNRCSGKTSRLMLIAKENNGTIVCSNPHAMKQKSLAYGIVGVDFISYYDFINNRDSVVGDVYIDEVEQFLNYVCSDLQSCCVLDGFTLSTD